MSRSRALLFFPEVGVGDIDLGETDMSLVKGRLSVR